MIIDSASRWIGGRCLSGWWPVGGGSVVGGFNKKIMFGVLISPVQFGGVLFCYSNCNFFYIDDKEEAIFINYP